MYGTELAKLQLLLPRAIDDEHDFPSLGELQCLPAGQRAKEPGGPSPRCCADRSGCPGVPTPGTRVCGGAGPRLGCGSLLSSDAYLLGRA